MNPLQEKFKKGELSVGTFTQLGSPIAVECLGRTGLDYVLIDTEHCAVGVEFLTAAITAADAAGITPLVRINEISRSAVLQPLDYGAQGKARIDEEIASFKEDPKAYQNQVVEKASDYKDLAVDTFQDYKTKFENGDITADDLTKAVQEKTAQVADFAKESFELIKEKTAQVTPEQADVEAETKAIVDDIVIDIKDISEEAAEAK